jgi:ferrous iron transport protein A
MNLIQLDIGKMAIIKELQGGQQVIHRLEAMGITPGSSIVKKNASVMKGPLVVQKGSFQMAIGYGMAKKIIVEPIDN